MWRDEAGAARGEAGGGEGEGEEEEEDAVEGTAGRELGCSKCRWVAKGCIRCRDRGFTLGASETRPSSDGSVGSITARCPRTAESILTRSGAPVPPKLLRGVTVLADGRRQLHRIPRTTMNRHTSRSTNRRALTPDLTRWHTQPFS